MPRSICSMPAISLWMRRTTRLQGSSSPSWPDTRTDKSVPCSLHDFLQRLAINELLLPVVIRSRSATPAGLVAPRPLQRKTLERAQLTVRPHHVVIGDLDRGDASGL